MKQLAKTLGMHLISGTYMTTQRYDLYVRLIHAYLYDNEDHINEYINYDYY